MTDTTEQTKAVKALRDARKIIRTGPVDLYRFESGKWSWCVATSPIGQQLRTDGHIYPTVKAARWFTVGA